MKNKIIFALVLASMLTSGALLSCGDDAGTATDTGASTGTAAVGETTGTPDPFDSFDFGGEQIRFWVNENDNYGTGCSNYLLIDKPETAGDIVNDAVIARNTYVEELLNVDLVFTDCAYTYGEIMEPLANMISAGDDAYDVVVHDLSRMVMLSVEGYFANIRNGAHYDFTQDYWYNDIMLDLSFNSDSTAFILAGDFFLDILRSTPALYVNKDLFNTLYESADVLYEHVLNKKWTIDLFLSYIKDTYQDLNGDNKAGHEDRYGYSTIGMYGSAYQWINGGDLTFIKYDSDGVPSLAINNERSVKMLEKLNEIFYDPSSHDYADSLEANTAAFVSGNVLFAGYQRVSSFEIFRDMNANIGILPYPMLDETQTDYVTALSDIATLGVIPTTCTKQDTVSAVLEVLCRETQKTVLPAYYEDALKVKYARDDTSSLMLDIIRGSLKDGFHLAYNKLFDYFLCGETFTDPLAKGNTTFASTYEKNEKKAQLKLEELWDAFNSVED